MTDHPVSVPPAVVRMADYTKADIEEIFGVGEDHFGVAYTGLSWLPKDVHFGIRDEAGRLVAHTGLLRLPLTVGGHDLDVMGVGGVAVAPDVRGRGLARTVVGAALDHARTLGPRHALLFCRPQVAGLYRRLGFRELLGDVHVEQPEGRVVVMPICTMWAPLHEGAAWPEGPVRLRSLPM
ncbi:GNAT family N-acetyltransferase [Kitasatospora sp. NPDC056181]|uniref:GNAT family N-acetyltransferase n=1 Tax=Kitasatospora sp. NPDC056181 TaxID=3345737 RepID=UPI0035D871C1